MSTVKAVQHQVGNNATDSKNIVLTADVSTGDLVISKGVYDGTLTEISRIMNAGGGAQYVPAGTGAVATTVQTKLRESVSVLDFGAVGDGVADDSTAWAAAVAYANTQAFAAIGAGLPIGTTKLYFPAGDYVINTGTTVANVLFQVEGAGREVTRIRIGSGQTLLTATATIYEFGFRGITTSGGTGVLAQTFTGVNVQGIVDIQDNNFVGYSGTAIGTLSSDFPYWKVKNNLFYGTATSRGVLTSGNPDLWEIIGNAFLYNLYHVVLRNGGNNAKIENNDFIRFAAGIGTSDIWVIPNAIAINSGTGLRLEGNKFGNENLGVNDIRMLIADAGAGTNLLDKVHATTASTGYFIGAQIKNYVAGVASQTKGFIYSYTPNLRTLNIDNTWVSTYPYTIQYDAVVTVPNDRLVDSNVLSVANVVDASEQLFGQASSAAEVTYARDPMSLYGGRSDFMNGQPAGFDPGLVDLWTTGTAAVNYFTLSSATRVATTDSTSDSDAGEITFTASSGFAYGYSGNPVNGRLGWAEIEIKAASTLPLTQLDIRMQCDNGDILCKRVVAVPAVWQRIRLPFMTRSLASPVSLQIRPVTSDFSAGVKTKVQIGRPRVYQASEAVDFGSRYLQSWAVYNPGTVGAGAGVTTTVTCTGAALGDFAQASFSVDLASLTVTAYVSAANTVTVRFQNGTGSGVTPGNAVLRVKVNKSVTFPL